MSKKEFRGLVDLEGPYFAVKFVQDNHPRLLAGSRAVTDLSPVELVQVYAKDPRSNLGRWALKRLKSTNATFDEWVGAAEGTKRRETGAKWNSIEIRKVVQRKLLLSAKTYEQYETFVEITEFRRYPNSYWFNLELAIALRKMEEFATTYDQWEEVRCHSTGKVKLSALSNMCRLAKTPEQLVYVYRKAELGSPPQKAAINRLDKLLTSFEQWEKFVPGSRSMAKSFPLEEFALQRMAALANTFNQYSEVLSSLIFYEMYDRHGEIVENALQSMVKLTKDEEFNKWKTIYGYTKEGSDLDNLALEKMTLFPSSEFFTWHSLVGHFGRYSLASKLGKLALEKMVELAKDPWDWKYIYQLEGLDSKTRKLVAKKMMQLAA